LEARLTGHITASESNKAKSDYIQNIITKGGKPIIESVEVIKGTCYIDKYAVNEREIYWIKYYTQQGCKLLNVVATSPNAKDNEFHGYLSSLKNGETQWKYYFCGKTKAGYEVYDEARLNADGFKLPVPNQCLHTENHNDDYRPWDNPRFVQKIGYRSRDDRYSYVPCYNDMNPDFYDDDY
jgi:hypothetical protein